MNIFKAKRSITFVAACTLLLSSPLFIVTETAQAAASQYPAWSATQEYPANSVVTYNGKIYKTQWWANAGMVPKIGANPWDSPWVLVADENPGEPGPGLPSAPVMGSVPAQIDSGKPINLTWRVDAGVVGTKWEAIANDRIVHEAQLDSATLPQTGSTALTLADGTYSLSVKLCNTTGCTTSASASVKVGKDTQPPVNAPGVPRINWMAPNVDVGTKIDLVWTLDYGVTGTSWELFDNGTKIHTGTLTPVSGNTQTASVSLPALAEGAHAFVVKLCNAAGCSAGSAAVSVVAGANPNEVPDVPEISYIPTVSSGQAIPVTWNIYWIKGTGGTRWEALIDGKSALKSSSFTINAGNKQQGTGAVPNDVADGDHVLTIKLCSTPDDSKCSQAQANFKVGNGQPAPAPLPTIPVMTAPVAGDISSNGEFSIQWNWHADKGVAGTAWQVSDTFNGTTTVVLPRSTQFVTNTPTSQSGTGTVKNLANGAHVLMAQLCNAANACTNSAVVNVTVEKPPAPLPGTPIISTPTNGATLDGGKLSLSWSMSSGQPGSYWEAFDGTKPLVSHNTQFIEETATSQTGALSYQFYENGNHALKVNLCNEDAKCVSAAIVNVTVENAPDKKPFFVAYYPSWSEPSYTAFNGDLVLSDSVIAQKSRLAGGIPDYVTHVVLAFAKPNQMRNYTGLSKTDGDLNRLIGLGFTASSASIAESIRVLKQRHPGIKVMLALGGASYNDFWDITPADIEGMTRIIKDLGLDGLDIDYEKDTTNNDDRGPLITEYYNAIKQIREAVDLAGGKAAGKVLSIPGWSVGASCTSETKGAAYPQCDHKTSDYGMNRGRERMVLQGRGAAHMLDFVTVMAYDADYTNFDPVTAYNDYREIVVEGTPVALGIQPSPDEGWGNARTSVVNKGTPATCIGHYVLVDQYSVNTKGTFSVDRFAAEVKKNPGDGMMMWSLFASRDLNGNDIMNPAGQSDEHQRICVPDSVTGALPPQCQALKVCVNDVTALAQGVSQYLGIGSDRTTKIDYQTGVSYGR